MKFSKIKIGSRQSRLAQAQVQEILELLTAKDVRLEFDLKTYQTAGDKDKIIALTENMQDDFFTDTIDEAILKGEIDIAVHSAKDIPQVLGKGLRIFALTAPLDETDAFVGRCRLSELKPGAKIGTSSLLRRKTIETLYPHIRLVDIRGDIDERIAKLDRGELEGVIVATCALKRLKLDHRIKDILPYETTPLQGQLAVVGREEIFFLREIFAKIDVRLTYGRVSLVGAGPGDPELITVKAINRLKETDVVFYDFLIHKSLLDFAPDAEKIYVGKRKGDHTLPQDELCRLLKEKAVAGKNVVRLKGGDPLIFGRGAEEMNYLQAYHIRVDVVAGVISATGIPASLGVPLTSRDVASSVAFVSGHGPQEKDSSHHAIHIPLADTVVFFMGVTKLNEIISSLIEAGWQESTPVMIISKGTTSEEKVVVGTVGNIVGLVAKERPEPPALIIVGEVVRFWEKREGFHKPFLYLGTNPEKYRYLGNIIHFPMIEIVPHALTPEMVGSLLQKLPEYHLILLTSRFAVQHFFRILKDHHYSLKNVSAIDFAVIGEGTAMALRDFQLTPKITAPEETGQGLLKVLMECYNLSGMKILFPRSSLSNPFLKEALLAKGARVDELTIYQNRKPMYRELPPVPVEGAVFTSPSTVRNFLEDYGVIPASWQILAKGPLTQKALEKAGYKCQVIQERGA